MFWIDKWSFEFWIKCKRHYKTNWSKLKKVLSEINIILIKFAFWWDIILLILRNVKKSDFCILNSLFLNVWKKQKTKNLNPNWIGGAHFPIFLIRYRVYNNSSVQRKPTNY